MTDILSDATPRVMRRNIFRLSWPATLRMLLQSLVGVVDIIMIGQLGSSAIAAVDIANRLVFVLIGTLMALTIATTTLVAQNIGAGNRQMANHIMWQSLLGGVIAATILETLLTTCVIDKNAAHCFSRGCKEMGSAFPIPGLRTHQADISLVNKSGCLECLTGGFPRHLLSS